MTEITTSTVVPDPKQDGGLEADLSAMCHVLSFTPHMLEFFGDAEAILAHVDAAGMDLTERRMFLLAVEGADGRAEVHLYEQVSGEAWSVSSWHRDDLGDLRGSLSQAILANKGVFCVGEQTKGVLSRLGIDVELEGTVPAPHSPRAAFGHAIRRRTHEGYGRALIALLC